MPEIKGIVYRIRTHDLVDAILFEAEDRTDPETELKRFCAEYAAQGHLISSVSRVYPGNRNTPRVSIMDKEFWKFYSEACERLQPNQEAN